MVKELAVQPQAAKIIEKLMSVQRSRRSGSMDGGWQSWLRQMVGALKHYRRASSTGKLHLNSYERENPTSEGPNDHCI